MSIKLTHYKALNGRVIKDISISRSDEPSEVIVSITVEGNPEESYNILTKEPKPAISIMHLKDEVHTCNPVFEKDYSAL